MNIVIGKNTINSVDIWVDVFGRIRGRFCPNLSIIEKSNTFTLPMTIDHLSISGDVLEILTSNDFNYNSVIDLSKSSEYLLGDNISKLCFYKINSPLSNICSRTLLENLVSNLEVKKNIQIGFELEGALIKENNYVETEINWFGFSSIRKLFPEIFNTYIKKWIYENVDYIYGETSMMSIELTFPPLDALFACDLISISKGFLAGTKVDGYCIQFSPIGQTQKDSHALQLNISIPECSNTDSLNHHICNLLSLIDNIWPILLPNPNDIVRFSNGVYSPKVYYSSADLRDGMLRIRKIREKNILEFRGGSNNVNPYLLATLIIGCIYQHGCFKSSTKNIEDYLDKPIEVNNLISKDKIQRFRNNTFINAVLGKDFVSHYSNLVSQSWFIN